MASTIWPKRQKTQIPTTPILIGVIVSVTYVFGVIAIFDKRLIGKRPYIRH